MKKKLTFIINPVSGGKDKSLADKKIRTYIDKKSFYYEIFYSRRKDHAYEISMEASRSAFGIVAVGGDGTINEIVRGISDSDKNPVLGIIPSGSGNGLARHLGIPMNTKKAINIINTGFTKSIDLGYINGVLFCNVAGLGFDAHVSTVFAENIKRGFLGYAKTIFKEFGKFKPSTYIIDAGNSRIERKAFGISFANSSQFGNNAYISPLASIYDGLLDIVIVKPFPFFHMPLMAFNMMNKTIHKSGYVEIIRSPKAKIIIAKPEPVHIDGEPGTVENYIEAGINPMALNVFLSNKSRIN